MYRLFEQAIPSSVCDIIVSEGKALETKVAQLREESGEDHVDEAARKTRVAFWNASYWINGLLHHHIHLANSEIWHYHISDTQGVQFGIYGSGGTYNWHKDEFDQPFGKEGGEAWCGQARKLSAVVNLTDPNDYRGGELRFKDTYGDEVNDPTFQEKLKQKGSLVVFPATIVHTVTPVESGERCSLVSWMLGKPFV